MRHRGLLDWIKTSEEFKQLEAKIESGIPSVGVYGIEESQKHLLMGLLSREGTPLLIITGNEDAARKTAADIAAFNPGKVEHFQARDFFLTEVYAQTRDIISQRIRVLRRLSSNRLSVVVSSFDAFARVLPPTEMFAKMGCTLRVNQVFPRDNLLAKLVAIGYERVEVVETPGQFAVRGGLVDVFPVAAVRPLRIEYFGEEVDTIRTFDPSSQLSRESFPEMYVPPAAEFALLPEHSMFQSSRQVLLHDLETTKHFLGQKGAKAAVLKLEAKFDRILEDIETGNYSSETELLLPFFFERQVTILDYFPSNPLVLLDEPGHLQKTAREREKEMQAVFEGMLFDGGLLSGQRRMLLGFDQAVDLWKKRQTVCFALLARSFGEFSPEALNISGRTLPEFHGRSQFLLNEIAGWKKAKYAVILMTTTKERGERLKQSLWDNGIEAVLVPELQTRPRPGQVLVTFGSIGSGFDLPTLKLVIISDREIFGSSKIRKVRKYYDGGIRITDFGDIKPGDYVVHVQHGIGKYLGIKKLHVQGVQRDYLDIQYKGQDRLYIPTDQIDLMQKYVGAEGHRPKLHKLGSGEWAKAKARVKSSVQDLARELLNLYAARETVKGHPFSLDSAWQAEFEDAFPFKETRDQLRVIQEVKADMEKPKPMDRLLVGDVGYGKTEVALRAAFKAVMDGKQVALLVPTTVLAQQHYHTFKERFEKFPVTIQVVSRLKKTGEQKRVIQAAAAGSVDIVIGTHRLLSKDVRFKDLGLLIIDEEQRFGVTHKEKLKQLRENVDVLTLTATPIPRTLHMALAGARDMSVIDTPPENRYPVQTYVLEYNKDLILEAIRRELARGGQVYYVHNNISRLERIASDLSADLYDGEVAVGHGQMLERQLEKVMLDFIENRVNVLVCTTIIENGLDISNVNTLIVEDADNFGLAQLYQLRGRIGRSNRIAYAYFTYNSRKILSEIAEKRLSAISEFTELGSGFKLAVRDLQIRGAGNLLGPEQHGHMLAVGFDLYCQLLEEAVNTLKGKPSGEPSAEPVEIEMGVSAYISENYVKESALKLEIYHRLKNAASVNELKALRSELEDRYGSMPREVENLFGLAVLRIHAHEVSVKAIKDAGKQIRVIFNKETPIKGEALIKLAQEFPRRLSFSSTGALEIKVLKKEPAAETIIQELTDILCKIKELAA